MSNGNGEFDAFDSGFDVPPDISDEDAIDFQIESDLGEIGEELDELMQGLVAPAIEEGRSINGDISQVRTQLSVAMASEVVTLQDEVDELRASMIDVVDDEAAILNNDVVPLAAVVGASEPDVDRDPVCSPGAVRAIAELNAIAKRFPGDQNTQLSTSFAISVIREHGEHAVEQCGPVPAGGDGFAWKGLGLYGRGVAISTDHLSGVDDQNGRYRAVAAINWVCAINPATVGVAGFNLVQQERVWLTTFSLQGPGCFSPPSCVCIADDEPPVPPPVPDIVPGPSPSPGPVPITPPIPEFCPEPEECPVPDGRVIVALDCSTRLLIVINAAELANFPDAIEIAECAHGEQFDIDELCRICETPEEDPEPDPIVLPSLQAIRFAAARNIECNLPEVNLVRPAGGPPGIPRLGDADISSMFASLLKRVLSGDNLLALFGGIGRGGSGPGMQLSGNIIKLVFDALRSAYADVMEFGVNILKNQLGLRGCLKDRSLDLVGTRAVVAVINGLTFGSLKEELVAYDQQVSLECPTGVPSAQQALAAWLANRISPEQLRCWVEANNFRWDEWKFVADSAQKRPGMLELLGMWRRGIIDEGTLQTKARNDGWVNQVDVDRFKKLTVFVPGPSDLVRFMVRDVADERNINWVESDNTFRDKFKGPMLDWAKSQGMDEEVMKFQWRAHWRIPSPTQLFTMLHRIGRRADGSEIVDFKKRVRGALQQDDVHPDWVDELMAINFQLPRLTQVRKLILSGLFDREQVMAEFVKRGLETKTAEAMTKFEMESAEKAFRSNPLVTEFSKGTISEPELRAELAAIGAGDPGIESAISWGRLKMTMDRREKCLASIRHKVIIGEIDRQQAATEALAQTGDQRQANDLSEMWECERDSRSKISTASELCAFFKDGLIGQGDFLRGLLRINMPLQRAQQLIARCQRQLTLSQEKEEERERKKAEGEARRAQKEAEKISKLSASQLKQRQSALERANAAKDRQEGRLVRAAKTIANRHGLDYETLLSDIVAISRAAVNDGMGKMEEVSTIAQTISTSSAVTGPISFRETLLSTLTEIG